MERGDGLQRSPSHLIMLQISVDVVIEYLLEASLFERALGCYTTQRRSLLPIPFQVKFTLCIIIIISNPRVNIINITYCQIA
jgi:hypothetical protein